MGASEKWRHGAVVVFLPSLFLFHLTSPLARTGIFPAPQLMNGKHACWLAIMHISTYLLSILLHRALPLFLHLTPTAPQVGI